MSNKHEIKSEKIYIQNVFSMWFRIPEYQRPYVWGNDQINDLLDDLSYAALNNPDSDYFLGSFVFQHKPADKSQKREFEENDLLDGQQRLTTLFLLMAVARDLTSSKDLKDTCQEYIFQKANPFRKIPEILRIQFKIRPEVEDFVNEFIKEENGTLRLKELEQISNNKDTDLSIKNMAKAVIQLNTYFSNGANISLESFFEFLLNKVLMIYVSSEELDDAFRLFTILNDRGVKLRNSDILKAENLRALTSDEKKKKWGKFWEELESEHQEDFDRFMSWIRTVLVKEKARLNLLKEFEDNIYNPKEKDKTTGKQKPILLTKGEKTFELLQKYNKHHQQLFSRNNYDFCNSWGFDNLLAVMEAVLPSTDWVPPLLSYYNTFGSENIYQFLVKLDNKFSADWINQLSPTGRIDNMNSVLKEIESGKTSGELLESDVFKYDLTSMLRNLEGNIYGRQFTRYILFKLDYLCFDHHSGKLTICDQISVEHILPQNPSAGSEWLSNFSNEERENYINKIGNLILLGRRKNTSQGNLDFNLKKLKYFKTSINTFPNSVRVMNKYNTWTPSDFLENQAHTIKFLNNHYLN